MKADDIDARRRQDEAAPAGGLAPSGERSAPARQNPARQNPARPLDFDVVIATRNRPEALALSIPLILGQSRQPERLIVVDSSDEHAPVAETVAERTAGWGGRVIVEHTAPGSAYQRNVGLAHVEAEVVFFPDDDSLFHPGTSAAIMRAYELDTEGRIAGVCAADAPDPLPGLLAEARYEMAPAHRREATLTRYRKRFERRIQASNPLRYLGEVLQSRAEPLDWFAAENCVLVEYMTGYRMSFRTAVIRADPFDETLRSYALNEDLDASFAAMRHGCLVGARNARIYHHRFPGGRGDPYSLGVMRVLNRCYVALKHVHDAGLAPAEAQKVRRLIRQFSRSLVLTSLPLLHKQSGREQLRGVLAALGGVRAMLDAPREELPRIYSESRSRILARQSS